MPEALLTAVREAAGAHVWGAAVRLARDGGVQGVSNDGDEVRLRVRAPGKSTWHEVYLWPGEPDWGCDCELRGDCCVHVAAGAIEIGRLGPQAIAGALPEVADEHKVSVRYDFRSNNDALTVARVAVRADGSEAVLKRSLAKLRLVANRIDVQAESVMALAPGGALSAETLRSLLAVLETESLATMNGEKIKVSPEPIRFCIRVTDEGEGFRLGLVRPAGIDRLFRGAAIMEGVLRPTSHGELTVEQRQMLVRGVTYDSGEVGALVSEVLPRLAERAPIDIQTSRLPEAETLVPRVEVTLVERPEGLEVRSSMVYGDPAVARLDKAGVFTVLSDKIVPARDLPAERNAARSFQESTGFVVGFPRVLRPSEAAEFLRGGLERHDGPVRGRVDPKRFEVRQVELTPRIDVREEDGGWVLDVGFGDDTSADAHEVLRAWQTNRPLVPLLDGGYAPLPSDWLAEHGAMLLELLEQRDAKHRVGRNATAALVELVEQTSGEAPDDLRKLRAFLEGEEGLPDVEIPKGLNAELRPYQKAGLQWLRFLRNMELSGILADDMGLGKTVQALASMVDVPGKHLVVAPTSVLRNWSLEAEKFVPDMKVSVFHGPARKLDLDADITVTSYALLRIDLERLSEVPWATVCLDEAQAIKNARSQTARAACALPAAHRLALTGTPVENRLEELWSLFNFLMPGLLGTESSFKERFSKPIEAGDGAARSALRGRVRPYVLRRLKSQVASELPPLTEIVERCALPDDQRKVYDTVRFAARQDVQKLLASGGSSAIQVLEALLRMRQACCDPSLLPGDVGEGVTAAKLDRMEELLVELVSEGHRALVFSQWTSLLDRVQARLDALGIDWTRLDGSTRDRQSVIDGFQADDGPSVFLLSLKAGGFGLNLTAADYVLHLDPWWNPAVERQATDRAHRIGQQKPVVSIKLVAQDTVEDKILALQDAKRDLADAALGAEGGFLRALSADELRSLFS